MGRYVTIKKRGIFTMSLKHEAVIRKMTLEEKALMMSGKNTWETVDYPQYGIPYCG